MLTGKGHGAWDGARDLYICFIRLVVLVDFDVARRIHCAKATICKAISLYALLLRFIQITDLFMFVLLLLPRADANSAHVILACRVVAYAIHCLARAVPATNYYFKS